MPNAAAALLALALHHPITDSGVWLEAPPAPGTVVSGPLVVTGETQAPEGVLAVRLYVVRGATSTEVASAAGPLPGLGPVPFSLTWTPAAPGTYTLRVVSSTALRGFSAEVRDLVVRAAPGVVVPGPPAAVRPPAPVPAVRPAPLARPARHAARRVVARLDDSGRAFGRSAPTLPYRPAPPAVAVAAAPRQAALPAVPVSERRGWLSVAGGLLLLLVCSHLHRSLRPQPEPRGPR
jgi:hypothetical protein